MIIAIIVLYIITLLCKPIKLLYTVSSKIFSFKQAKNLVLKSQKAFSSLYLLSDKDPLKS